MKREQERKATRKQVQRRLNVEDRHCTKSLRKAMCAIAESEIDVLEEVVEAAVEHGLNNMVLNIQHPPTTVVADLLPSSHPPSSDTGNPSTSPAMPYDDGSEFEPVLLVPSPLVATFVTELPTITTTGLNTAAARDTGGVERFRLFRYFCS